jgi:hypothetical protein
MIERPDLFWWEEGLESYQITDKELDDYILPTYSYLHLKIDSRRKRNGEYQINRQEKDKLLSGLRELEKDSRSAVSKFVKRIENKNLFYQSESIAIKKRTKTSKNKVLKKKTARR